MFEINVVTVADVSPQWLDGDEAEDEGAAEDGDEAEVDQEDDYKVPLFFNISLFVQDFFFLYYPPPPPLLFFYLEGQSGVLLVICVFFLTFVH